MPEQYLLELKSARAYPLEHPYDEAIITRAGSTTPFAVERAWRGPAGHYREQWSIRTDSSVLFRSEVKVISIRGIQSISTYVEPVTTPLNLEPGDYQLVFIVEGRYMGAAPIRVAARDGAAV